MCSKYNEVFFLWKFILKKVAFIPDQHPGNVLCPERYLVWSLIGCGCWYHRPEWCRKVDSAEDPFRDYVSVFRGDKTQWPVRESHEGRGWFSSRAHRPGECISQWGDPWDGPAGGWGEVWWDRRVCRDWEIYWYFGEAVFERDVCQVGVCGEGITEKLDDLRWIISCNK